MALDVLNSASARFQIGWDAAKNQTGLNGVSSSNSLTKNVTFTLGVGAGQINEVVSQIRTLAASTNEELDLAAALANVVNDPAVALARIKVLAIQLLSTTDDSTNGTLASSITIGNAAATPWQGPFGATTHTITVPNGGFVVLGRTDATGWAVTNGAADKLKIANNDAGLIAAYRITLFGGAT